MNYLKKVLNAMDEVFLFLFIQIVAMFSLTLVYNLYCIFRNIEASDSFLLENGLLLGLIIVIVFLKYIKPSFNYEKIELNILQYIHLLLFGIIGAISFNYFLLLLNEYFEFYSVIEFKKDVTIDIIITSSFIGPILEEITFRGILYNKIKNFNKPFMSYIVTGLIFGIMHFNIPQFIFAFLANIIFIYTYEKYKTIKAPIIVHIILNLVTLFLPYYFDKFIFIGSSVILFMLFYDKNK